jgi:hypothetical protein
LVGDDILLWGGCSQLVIAFQAPGIIARILLRALQENIAAGKCRWDKRQAEQSCPHSITRQQNIAVYVYSNFQEHL